MKYRRLHVHKFIFIIAATVSISSCQTTNTKEEKLVLAPGFFQPENVTIHLSKSTFANNYWLTAQNEGRHTGVSFSMTHGFGVISRGKALSTRELKRWNRFKKTEITHGVESKVQTPLGHVPVKRFYVKKQECFFFQHQYIRSSSDAMGRFTRQLSGYFCEKSDVKLNDRVISEYLHQIGDTRRYDPRPAVTADLKPSSHKETQKKSDKSEIIGIKTTSSNAATTTQTEYRIHGTWEGEAGNINGTFSTNSAAARGKLKVKLESVKDTCLGNWIFAKGKFNTSTPPQGTWSVACQNGRVASGTYKSFKIGEGMIEGIDNSGNKINMQFD